MFQNIKIELILRTLLTLKSSLGIFQALESLQPQLPWQPLQSQWPQWPQRPHLIKNLADPDGSMIPSTKMNNTDPFCGMDHQKCIFLLILAPFLSEAIEDSWCYFFENWFMKLKIYNLLKPLGTIIQQNCWSFCPSELIYFAFFSMRHPV